MAAEKQFENKIKKFLDEKGAWYIKYWAGVPYTKAGVPDILACVEGNFLGIEVKAERGKPELLQLRCLQKIHDAGGYALLLYPEDFEGFCMLIKMMRAHSEQINLWTAYLALSKKWKDWLAKKEEVM